jgi:hypothetical protein
MKSILAAAAAALVLMPAAADAGERGGDAVLGALAGAVVFGPVGAVAGAAVGFTSGPSIARDLGVRRHYRRRHPVPPRVTNNR